MRLLFESRSVARKVAVREHTTAVMDKEFDPRVPLALEKVLVRNDYAVLSSMLKNDSEALRKGLSELEEKIAKHLATDSLSRLCPSICDRRALLWLLHPFSRPRVFAQASWSSSSPGPGSIESLLGLGSGELRSLTKKMNEVASQLDRVNGQAEFSALLMMSKELYPVYRLPRALRAGARVMQYAAKHFAGNTHIYDNIAKARLTSFVLAKIESSYAKPRRKKRREYRDEDVASLISAVWGDKYSSYDFTAHRMWRRKHYERLAMLDPDVDQMLPVLMSELPKGS
jgi:hypothetical protein